MRQVILQTSSPYIFSALEALKEIELPITAEIAIKTDNELTLSRTEKVVQVEVPVDQSIVHPSSDIALELLVLPEFAHEGLGLLWFYPFSKNGEVVYMAGLDTSGLATDIKIEKGEYLFAGRYQNKVNVRIIRD